MAGTRPCGWSSDTVGSCGSGMMCPVGDAGRWRAPRKTWLFFVVTLSFYDIYWWYQVNRELRELLRDDGIRPGLSVVTMYIPGANVVSLLHGGERIRQGQEAAGLEPTCSPWRGVLLTAWFAMNIPYHQGELNKVWQARGAGPQNA